MADTDDAQQEFRKVAEGFDFPRTVNWKLMQAMALPRNSRERVHAVEDLHDLLFSKRDKKYLADIEILTSKVLPNGQKEITDYEAYASGLVHILIRLMDRNGLLGKTTVEEEF